VQHKRQTHQFSLSRQEAQQQKYLEFIFQFHQVFLGLIGIPAHRLDSPEKEIAGSKIGTCWE
jgi:hypothetical protein